MSTGDLYDGLDSCEFFLLVIAPQHSYRNDGEPDSPINKALACHRKTLELVKTLDAQLVTANQHLDAVGA
jgi:hypothetical protein